MDEYFGFGVADEVVDFTFLIRAVDPDTGKTLKKAVCAEHLAMIQKGQSTVKDIGKVLPVVEAERISVVCYYRTKMADCGTVEEEEKRHVATAARRTGITEEEPVGVMGG